MQIPGRLELANAIERDDLNGFLAGLFGSAQTVARDTDLQTYLDEKLIPRWYQKLLLRYDRIEVQMKKADGTLGHAAPPDDPRMPLRQSSIVTINEALEGEFKVYYEAARDAPRDYVLQPVPNPHDWFLRHVEELHRRAGSYVFGGHAGETTLQDFVRQVGKAEITETPPRNLIVISHAHWSRQLDFVPTNAPGDADAPFTYEDIDRLAAALRIPNEHLEPRTDANRPCRLIFTGCAFGQAAPFLKKLRDAINPTLAVIAPKHFFGISQPVDDPTIFIEFMAREHTVYAKRRLGRAELIVELRKAPKRLDAHDRQVGDEEWTRWLPDEPWPAGDSFFVAGKTFSTALWFEQITQKMPDVPVAVDKLTFEADRDGRFKAAIAALADPTHALSTAHPFPWWMRFGFADAGKMVDGLVFTYTFTVGTGGRPNTVTALATGSRYAMIVPIRTQAADAAGNHRLLGNYYGRGPGGSGHVLIHEDYPLPKLPLAAHGPLNTKYWKVLEPA